jgi:shikimate dehydrogenase
MIINQATKLYGVVGLPIGHSLSPIMHNAAFEALSINAVCLAFETQNIQDCLRGMKALPIRGLSVTIPHKTAVIPLLDEVDDLSGKIGAVNTIVNRDDRLKGYNTDAIGALRALEEKIDLGYKRCMIIGAGGAARAIGYILKEKGLDIIIANRTAERGKTLAHTLTCDFIGIEAIKDTYTDILINTTPVGMMPNTRECIVAEEVLKKHMVVMDIVYNPFETGLLAMAKARGCVTVSGLDMFVHQGAEQFRLWTGQDAPVHIMTNAVETALTR